ncbi:MAG: glycosyltransferase, partial [Sphaerochaetaceae bacterium]|nr:glycosyltransferase [Sphaerochaetaceae bacterium]
KIDETFKKDKPFILVVGGSLGSLEINELIFKHLDKLVEKYNIYHQMGNQTYKKIEKDCYIGVKQIGEELGYLYKKADLIISRCGANTLNEEIFFRKNILAIPLKNNASRGEQVLNAKYFKKLNMLEVYEKNMNLIDTVKNLLNNNVIEQRNKAFNSFNYIDANETIYLKIKELMK